VRESGALGRLPALNRIPPHRLAKRSGVVEHEFSTHQRPLPQTSVHRPWGLTLLKPEAPSGLVLGVNAIELLRYPDCRPEPNLSAFSIWPDLASKSGREGPGTRLWAPLVEWDKARMRSRALRLRYRLKGHLELLRRLVLNPAAAVGQFCRIRDTATSSEAGRPDLASPWRRARAGSTEIKHGGSPSGESFPGGNPGAVAKP